MKNHHSGTQPIPGGALVKPTPMTHQTLPQEKEKNQYLPISPSLWAIFIWFIQPFPFRRIHPLLSNLCHLLLVFLLFLVGFHTRISWWLGRTRHITFQKLMRLRVASWLLNNIRMRRDLDALRKSQPFTNACQNTTFYTSGLEET